MCVCLHLEFKLSNLKDLMKVVEEIELICGADRGRLYISIVCMSVLGVSCTNIELLVRT